MATAQDIITDALITLNEVAAGETPNSSESAHALLQLNRLLSSWNAEGIVIPYVTTDGYTLTGAAAITIGTGGTINTTRPMVVKSMTIQANSVTREIILVTAERWATIRDFSRTGKFARFAWYNPTSPTLANIAFWPTPASGGVLAVNSLKPLTQFASLATTVTLPEGYERALVALLALELAPSYGAPVTEVLLANAQSAKAAIVGLNAAVLGTPPSQAQEAQPAA